MSFLTIFLLLLFCLSSQTMAESRGPSLEEIVVTATRSEVSLSQAPGGIEVLTGEQMELRNVKSLDNALNIIPGVYNKSGKGFMETTSSLSLRGIPDDKRLLFMWEGLPLNDPYSGSVTYNLLPIEDVERIEVVKGPFSSLWGGYAMSGVINVITRVPQKREFKLKTGYGTGWNRSSAMDDLFRTHLSYGDKYFDKLSVYIGYSYKSTNGYPTDFNVVSTAPPTGVSGALPTTDNKGAKRYLIGDRGDNTWWDDQLVIRSQYQAQSNTKIKFSLIRGRYKYEYEEPHTYLYTATGTPLWSYTGVSESTFLSGNGARESNIYDLEVSKKLAKGELRLKFGFLDRPVSWYTTRGTTATKSGGAGTVSETEASSFNGDATFSQKLFWEQTVTIGGGFRRDKSDTNEYKLTNWKDEDSKTGLSYTSKGKTKSYALFIQDEIPIHQMLTLYLGLRQDWWQTFDGFVNDVGKAGYPKNYETKEKDTLNPKVSLVMSPFPQTILKASWGKAFRPPTVYDLYRTWTSSSGVTYAANPDLKPEKVTAWDLGIEHEIWNGSLFKLTYFDNSLMGLIYRKTVSSTLQEHINAGKGYSKGIELSFEQKFGKYITFFTNYTQQRAKIEENPARPKSEGKWIMQVPKRLFNIGFYLNVGDFSGSCITRYVSKRFSTDDNTDIIEGVYTSYDSYTTTDLKLAYSISKNISVSASVDNLFNSQYFGYYKAPGSSWFIDLTLKY